MTGPRSRSRIVFEQGPGGRNSRGPPVPATGPGLPFLAGERDPSASPVAVCRPWGPLWVSWKSPLCGGGSEASAESTARERAPAGRAAPAQSRVLEDRSWVARNSERASDSSQLETTETPGESVSGLGVGRGPFIHCSQPLLSRSWGGALSWMLSPGFWVLEATSSPAPWLGVLG